MLAGLIKLVKQVRIKSMKSMKWTKDDKVVHKTIAFRVTDYERNYLWEISGGNLSRFLRSRLKSDLDSALERHEEELKSGRPACSIG